MTDIEKQIQDLRERLQYIEDIFGNRENTNITLLRSKLQDFIHNLPSLGPGQIKRQLTSLSDLFSFLENKLEKELTPMDRVRIVRHPQRVCLKDILENVYDNYTEIGGQGEYSIDPSMIIARAYITRNVGKKTYKQPVMVIGQEKGHGEEFRNGGSVKPWGNAKALEYMKVAERENIPIHTYIFTPGSYPIEDYPGAAQQIARNIYAMAGIRVPVIAVLSEGGSGGAEAIGLTDTRIMLSHGYYSVISPEGAAAIEGRSSSTRKASAQLVESCARQLRITARDNLEMGYVDRILQEPPLGARPDHFDFFRKLRREVILATDEIVLSIRGVKLFRAIALRKLNNPNIYVRWSISSKSKERLIWRRYQKYRGLCSWAYQDRSTNFQKCKSAVLETGWSVYSFLRYEFFGRHQRAITHLAEDVQGEVHALMDRVTHRFSSLFKKLPWVRKEREDACQLTTLSTWEAGMSWNEHCRYVSPQANQDKTLTCPNSEKHNCLDLWAPDLFGDFAGVCSHCGHHFPMEYEWYLFNVFDSRSIREFNAPIEASNPLEFDGLTHKLDKAKKQTGHKSACMTFEAKIKGIQVAVAMLLARFRGGSVGAAEGEKFIRAAEQARRKHMPFLAYVHGTAGIRIQEGTNGLLQMPRCTLAVRRYLESGGLYLVVYDTNSYAGPVASFLGCSPYQFAIRSANIGFAGPGVIRETTGMDIPPNYHKSFQALSRGHIQGIWDRREIRNNLHHALMTMGGEFLYYR
ncbi:Acetyl-CoA carboxylase [Desulfonatronospira thiodismutans ASO3-1]|uniref:Acetyl-coenzyme A carboxylase carboxyl transferase subunits beta/alpha n=1 Tax=Desulfonatronospira thiodismutans ASO3-1 TaxID=555779 RepID=D6SQC5_9BACT|nr:MULTISPECIES: carboxyl transferase domain-containing protein [Desulfonatronospira]EFI34951.1 Acetyl-CoA carboxylase [Desulfonatronospira thiodismutans ASO3-1]RQD74058.1 MAG: acetyl-CoA carboxylase carboxyl transferase subunit alpha/beta [Desulfonatronospira sp. MSAO_Bac3]